jgi:hypothetical protein
MMGNFGREIFWRETDIRYLLIPSLFTKFIVVTLVSDMTPTTPIAKEPVAQVH